MTREPSRARRMLWPGLAWPVLLWHGLVCRHQSTLDCLVGVAVRHTIAANMLSRINAR